MSEKERRRGYICVSCEEFYPYEDHDSELKIEYHLEILGHTITGGREGDEIKK